MQLDKWGALPTSATFPRANVVGVVNWCLNNFPVCLFKLNAREHCRQGCKIFVTGGDRQCNSSFSCVLYRLLRPLLPVLVMLHINHPHFTPVYEVPLASPPSLDRWSCGATRKLACPVPISRAWWVHFTLHACLHNFPVCVFVVFSFMRCDT